MSDHKFERLLSEIRSEKVDDRVVGEASDRVWKSISASPTADLSTHTLRSCEDFQALIPAYLEKNLPEARRFLFEDHMHQCVACRHAVELARDGEMQPVWQPKAASRTFPVWRWAMSAAAVAVVAAATFALQNGMFPGQHALRGSVQNVDGSLYAVVDDQVRVIPAGYQIRNGDVIRTAKGSNAEVRLLDGSLVEMSERLEADAKTVVFRIAQESLTNVNKHAQASQVAVAIRPFKGGICMEVADDGKSFKADPKDAGKSEGRLGLLGMQERVRLVNGQFTVKPRPGKGTTVRVMVPFKLSAQGSAPEQGGSPVAIKHCSPEPKLESASPKTTQLIQDYNYGTDQSSARG